MAWRVCAWVRRSGGLGGFPGGLERRPAANSGGVDRAIVHLLPSRRHKTAQCDSRKRELKYRGPSCRHHGAEEASEHRADAAA